jgi:copper oxidase (laccase) domain-containing protein
MLSTTEKTIAIETYPQYVDYTGSIGISKAAREMKKLTNFFGCSRAVVSVPMALQGHVSHWQIYNYDDSLANNTFLRCDGRIWLDEGLCYQSGGLVADCPIVAFRYPGLLCGCGHFGTPEIFDGALDYFVERWDNSLKQFELSPAHTHVAISRHIQGRDYEWQGDVPSKFKEYLIKDDNYQWFNLTRCLVKRFQSIGIPIEMIEISTENSYALAAEGKGSSWRYFQKYGGADTRDLIVARFPAIPPIWIEEV